MDLEKINTLRSKITIPLNIAISLLKKHGDDISVCILEFHNTNIKEISMITECEEEMVKAAYDFCKYDKTKTIERINSRPIIITSEKNKKPKNEIGFILWPEDENGESYKTQKRNDAFIPTADFDYILESIRAVFPLKNPWNKNIENSFDICGHNYFDHETCRRIIDNINSIKIDDINIELFLEEVKKWFNDRLEYADYIVIYGNL